jgi:signal transduction histidine kinase
VSTEYQHIIDKENRKKDLKIITESSDLAILVEADKIKITPVMYDLIDNAIKFTNNGNIPDHI